jgi:hypothetical protein
MGIATTSYMSVARPRDMSYHFLEHAHSLGAGGIQISLFGNEDLKKIRSRAVESVNRGAELAHLSELLP